MSYFDHVRCPACKSQIDPERLEVREGVAVCPSCKSQIGLKDMFGIAAAFDEDDDDTMTMDDLVGSAPGRRASGYDPTMSVAPAPPRKPSKPRQISGPQGVLSALDDLKKNR